MRATLKVGGRAAAAVALAAAVTAGCGEESPGIKGWPGSCRPGATCGVVGGGAGDGGGGDGGGVGEDAGTSSASVAGSLVMVESSTFQPTAGAYPGKASVTSYGPAGGTTTAAYDGSLAPTFTLQDIATGSAWVRAATDPADTSVLSSFSFVTIAPSAPLTLPVVDRFVLDGIALALGVDPEAGIDPGAAHLVLRVRRGGSPAPGVRLEGSVGGATLAYDTGPGEYDALNAQATGVEGIALLLNVATSGAVDTLFLELRDETQVFAPASPVYIAPATVTMAYVDLP